MGNRKVEADLNVKALMTISGNVHRFRMLFFSASGAIALLFLAAACSSQDSKAVQGYVEGEFVYVSSSLAGPLEELHVKRGEQVKAGTPLFALDSSPEKNARDEAQRRLEQARAALDDAKKGKRPTEIESLESQLQQAQTALALSEKELARQEKMLLSRATSGQDVDRTLSIRDQDRLRVTQLQADLKTARLGSRSDQIAEAAANVQALEAALATADWSLSQKRQTAPQSGLVFDALYRKGEQVSAGRPVVVLLPPQNIKVRAFVSEAQIALIHVGDKVRVTVDGLKDAVTGKVSFISPQAEYTPPVIYSRESRSKLVFMVEAVFDPETAAKLHPGQPVDLQFGL